MSTLYCIGEVWLCLSPADAAATLAQAGAFRAQIGGSVAALCTAVTRLGGHAALLTQLGDDPFGRRTQTGTAVFPVFQILTGEEGCVLYFSG